MTTPTPAATRADAMAALVTLNEQTLPGAAPLAAFLCNLLHNGDMMVAAGNETMAYHQLCCAVNRYLLTPT
jgi:hypothetical protein